MRLKRALKLIAMHSILLYIVIKAVYVKLILLAFYMVMVYTLEEIYNELKERIDNKNK